MKALSRYILITCMAFFANGPALSQNETGSSFPQTQNFDLVIAQFYGGTASPDLAKDAFTEAFLTHLIGDRLRFADSHIEQIQSDFEARFADKFLSILSSPDPLNSFSARAFLESLTEDVSEILKFEAEIIKIDSIKSLEKFLEKKNIAPWLARIILSFKQYSLNIHPESHRDAGLLFERQIQFLKRRVYEEKQAVLFKSIRQAKFVAVDKYWGTIRRPEVAGLGVGVQEVKAGIEIFVSNNPSLKKGDVITAFSINGGESIINAERELGKMDGYTNLIEKMRGPEGEAIHLWIRRGDQDLQIEVIRKAQWLSQLNMSEAEKKGDLSINKKNLVSLQGLGLEKPIFDEALSKIANMQKSGYQQVTIDLRNNPGGVLEHTIEFLSAFTKQRVLVVAQDAKGGVENYERVPTEYDFRDMQFTVLVNERTASAAEIIAGILQKLGANVIGTANTYGKGVTQRAAKINHSPFPLVFTKAERAGELIVKATVSEYFLLAERVKVDGIGITPDILVENWEDPRIPELTRATSPSRKKGPTPRATMILRCRDVFKSAL